MSGLTLREEIEAMPDGPMRQAWNVVLVLKLYAALPDLKDKTPWHLTPSFVAFRDGSGDQAAKLEKALGRLSFDPLVLKRLEYWDDEISARNTSGNRLSLDPPNVASLWKALADATSEARRLSVVKP